MRLVINTEIGGFGLSKKAVFRYAELKGITLYTAKLTDEGYEPVSDDFILEYFTRPIDEINKELRTTDFFFVENIPRHDPILIQVIEELGEEAASESCEHKIIEIPDDIEYTINEGDDGREWVAEKHRTWS